VDSELNESSVVSVAFLVLLGLALCIEGPFHCGVKMTLSLCIPN
jgi:hypothetical protein